MIIGIGTDIVELSRMEQVGLGRLIKKILTEEEQAIIPVKEKRKKEFVAGRFAAKEAISKALGTGIGAKFAFHDVEILRDELGAPKANWKDSENKPTIHLSISHSEQYAVAMVVLERN
ncbi:holo-ACP synthase [Shimazuella kribbensis]|uniref:holo-ACP synthase n=1 Tax=Shimazuella kribbensis TaxID=139808 RepID=UPI00041CEB97|nr:holo-ACP synthase [Shimazuella kribbensis]